MPRKSVQNVSVTCGETEGHTSNTRTFQHFLSSRTQKVLLFFIYRPNQRFKNGPKELCSSAVYLVTLSAPQDQPVTIARES